MNRETDNEDYVELIKTIKRARYDSLLGVRSNFLHPDNKDAEA